MIWNWFYPLQWIRIFGEDSCKFCFSILNFKRTHEKHHNYKQKKPHIHCVKIERARKQNSDGISDSADEHRSWLLRYVRVFVCNVCIVINSVLFVCVPEPSTSKPRRRMCSDFRYPNPCPFSMRLLRYYGMGTCWMFIWILQYCLARECIGGKNACGWIGGGYLVPNTLKERTFFIHGRNKPSATNFSRDRKSPNVTKEQQNAIKCSVGRDISIHLVFLLLLAVFGQLWSLKKNQVPFSQG